MYCQHGFCNTKKALTPTLADIEIKTFSVRPQGLEPWTNRLRVYCSTN